MKSTIFISHKTEDKEYANRILEFLRDHGYPSERLFLDSDASSGLMVGKKWQESLYARLQDCVCLIVVGTSKWATSKWCFAEAFIAKNRSIPIVVLKFDEEADLSFLSEYQAVQNFSIDTTNLSRLVEILTQNQLAPIAEGTEPSSGWKNENAEMSPLAQRELLEQVSQQVSQIQPDHITRRVTVSILAVVLLTIVSSVAYIFYGDEIAKLLNPPETLELTTEEFIEAVTDQSSPPIDVREKKTTLTGIPNRDYSASRPRITLNPVVEVNVNEMANGDPIPETLPHEPLQFSGTIESVNPLNIGGELVRVIVYMVDVEFPNAQ